MWAQQASIRSKMRFFIIFLSLDHNFSLKLQIMIDFDNISHLVAVKSMKKNLGDQIRAK